MQKTLLLLPLTLLMISSAFAKIEPQPEINKKNAIAFCETLANEKNFDKARTYIGDRYIQHDPKVEDGIDGLRKYFNFLTAIYPHMHIEVVRASADDEYAYVHMHVVFTPNTKGDAMVDIFRFENGKIVEHWDTIEEIPQYSKNNNGML